MVKPSKPQQQNKLTRQTRCERCILMHRPCDAAHPSCSLCANHRNGPLDCVYPEGQPSRSELKQRRMEEATAQEKKLKEQAANRKAAGITYGFGEGKYGTVPPSWPEKYGGLGGYQQMIDAAKKRAAESKSAEKMSEEEKRKRRRLEKKDYPIAGVSRGESPELEIDIAQGFPSLADGAPTTGPMEVRAPIAPSLGTPWGPRINQDWFNRPLTSITLKQIGINLVESLENSLPKHGSGVLKGRSDWSKVVTTPPETKQEQEEELKKVVAFQRKIIPILFPNRKTKEKKDGESGTSDEVDRGPKAGQDGVTTGTEVEDVSEDQTEAAVTFKG